MTTFDMAVTIELCIEITAEDYEKAEVQLRSMDDAELWEVASTVSYAYSGQEHHE